MAGAVKHAEVRWYRFAKPDKRRPVLVLSRSSAIPYLGELTVAPITSTVRGIPSEQRFELLDTPESVFSKVDDVALLISVLANVKVGRAVGHALRL